MYDGEYYDPEEWEERVERFADPGGNSALYPASKDNPRNLPCPTCHWPNRLTRADRARGYQCDSCANALERGGEIYYYEDYLEANGEEVELDDPGWCNYCGDNARGTDSCSFPDNCRANPFEPETAPDAHLEMDFEDRMSGDY
jgi:hypothetical protein